jgi:5,10-methylenetetrahydromethanopterin reductase
MPTIASPAHSDITVQGAGLKYPSTALLQSRAWSYAYRWRTLCTGGPIILVLTRQISEPTTRWRFVVVDVEVNINPTSIQQAAEFAVAAESLGASQIGVWDSPALYSECWTTLGAISQHVTSVPIGVAVTNPTSRHLVVTASALASLSRSYTGGVFLGVGTGDSGLRVLGLKQTGLNVLEDYIVAIRKLLIFGKTRWGGQELLLREPPDREVPIYMAAHGERSLAVASRVADGIFCGLGHSADVVKHVHAVVDRSASEAGRDSASIPIWWNTGGVTIAKTFEDAIEKGGWVAVSLCHHLARFRSEGKLIPEKYRDAIEELGTAYDLTRHGDPGAELKRRYVDCAKKLGVWDYLMDRFLIAGTPEQVQEQIRGLYQRGIRKIETGMQNDGLEEIRSILLAVRQLDVGAS